MSDKIREALEYSRNILWWLLVQNEKGNLNLTADQRARIDQAERMADDALKDPEDSDAEDE